MARRDPLETGVRDHPGITAAIERALAHGDDIAVVMITLRDEQGLSGVEDQRWDAVTAAAEARLLRTIRPDDLLGRLDDGRLVVMTAATAASRVAIRLGDRLREPFRVGNEPHRLAPQIGVGYPAPGEATAADILRAAENSPAY